MALTTALMIFGWGFARTGPDGLGRALLKGLIVLPSWPQGRSLAWAVVFGVGMITVVAAGVTVVLSRGRSRRARPR